MELQIQNIPYEREKLLNVSYKGNKMKKRYSADFVCYDSPCVISFVEKILHKIIRITQGKIVVELKALRELSTDHEAQLLNYLKTSGLKLGLLMNFGSKSLQYKRLIF